MPAKKAPTEAEVSEARASARNRRIAYRRLLKDYQPAAFRMLDTGLKQNAVSHALLFCGPRGTLKKEMAVLLAQSLALGSDHLIEEETLNETDANTADRIARNEYGSYIFLDGYRKKALSKEEIDDIETRFSRTVNEGNGRRIYVIDHAENASESAMSSLLKFLEEPGQEVYAVLTADNEERILATIRSRCTKIAFHPLPASVYAKRAEADGLDPEDAFFLSHLAVSLEGLGDLAASDSYVHAKEMLKQYLNPAQKDLLLVDYDRTQRKMKGNAADAKDSSFNTLNYFFSMLCEYYRDVLANDQNGPEWYHKAVEAERQKKDSREMMQKKLKIAVEEKDRLNRSNDLNLLLDQAVYRLEVTVK